MLTPLMGKSVVDRLGLSDGGKRVAKVLLDMPLSSAHDLACVTGYSMAGVYPRLEELREKGVIDGVSLGWTRGQVTRYWLTSEAVGVLDLVGSSWHEEWGLGRLLERLPLVEWFYRVVGGVEGLGAFERFQWLSGVSIDAVAEYGEGWVAVLWSGLFESENALSARLERMGSELMRMGVFREGAWPGLFCFVVGDRWQRELVYRAARKYGIESVVRVCSVDEGGNLGPLRADKSRGRLYHPVDSRDIGGWPWRRRVEESLWSRRDALMYGKLLEVSSEWSGSWLWVGGVQAGEGDIKRLQRGYKVLLDAGLVERQMAGGKDYRYWVTSKGGHILARRDGVGNWKGMKRGDVPAWIERSRLRGHEDGVLEVVESFMRGGRPVASGWRSWEHLGGRGGIAPDGLVYLSHSPYGPGWTYLEYERSARGEARVRRKLRGFASDRRRDSWPVLFVVWNEEVEKVYHSIGLELGVPMLTSTIERVLEGNVIDRLGCWSMYGREAVVG